jgi:hypothetical protein
MQSKCNSWIFLCLHYFLKFSIVWWVIFLVKYDRMGQGIRALQHIISRELNGDHLLTYEEAFTHQ